MESITQCLATNVRELRKKRGFTQTDLASQAKISLIFLQGIESERKWISPSTIKALADALQVPESKLFENCFAKDLAVKPSSSVSSTSSALSAQNQKLNHIPEDILQALATTCRHPQWKWEVFRWILEGYKRQISRAPR